jgi:hypothetical protein
MATQYANGKIVTSGLVLALDAADRNSYVSGSTVWNDMSGNGNNGTLINNPGYSANNGGAILFDGINDYVDVLPASSGSAISSYTFSTWYYPYDTSPGQSFPLQRGIDGSGNGWSLTAGAALNKYRVGVVTTSTGDVGYVVTSSISVQASTWVNITGVWNAGSSLSLYVNGSFQSSLNITTTTLRNSNSGWVLGRITNTTYSSQVVANCLVYNRVLPPSEILQNYNAQKSRFNLK